jgi:phosphotransferase system  glucose/maltose/N-acetylglucosamine-specific IIC component
MRQFLELLWPLAFQFLSETMTSIIEVLLAAGMIAGIMAIISLTGLVSKDSPTFPPRQASIPALA